MTGPPVVLKERKYQMTDININVTHSSPLVSGDEGDLVTNGCSVVSGVYSLSLFVFFVGVLCDAIYYLNLVFVVQLSILFRGSQPCPCYDAMKQVAILVSYLLYSPLKRFSTLHGTEVL